MLKSIQNGSKKDHQLLIKDLLESHDGMQEQQNQMLEKFARGKKLNDAVIQKKVVSRGVKERPSQRPESSKYANALKKNTLKNQSDIYG